MTVYPNNEPTTPLWPVWFEMLFQSLPSGPGTPLAPKLPHLSLSEALTLGMLTLIPRENRPYGLITWASELYGVSRTSMYELGKRIKARLLSVGDGSESTVSELTSVDSELAATVNEIEVTPARLKRTILAATFPGNVSIRPTQELLGVAFDQKPSIGMISELRLEAGRIAGRVLAGLDYRSVGAVIIGRDELFLQDIPLLLVVEPVSTTILLALACEDRQAETWGAVLELVQEQGLSIAGFVEDMARTYEKSQKLAALTDATVQKDVWHLLRDGAIVKRQMERKAYKAMHIAFELEKKLAKAWDEETFEHYVAAVGKEEQAIAEFDAYAQLLSHLYDALEIVDWRAGEIRDGATANWLLNETLTLMEQLTDKRIQSFVKTVRNHQPQLITYLAWVAADLPDWQNRLALFLPDENDADAFQRTVARHWRLQQMLTNGHTQWRTAADDAALELSLWTDALPDLDRLASELMAIFDAAGHTNSINECLNGILRSFLQNRQSFRNLETLQAYLDLFVLWHNMRVFQRGKRKGQSPFQIAGIQTHSDDWLTMLGF